MKIALACRSLLLEKSLEIFLKKFIAPYKQCDFVISDQKIQIDKPLFYIAKEGGNLSIPFSTSTLYITVEKFYNRLNTQNSPQSIALQKVDFTLLEARIEEQVKEFQQNLIKTLRDFYEKN
ncbi:MAG: hypothetical protein IBX44_02380 [Sulfurospirillum sp.]|nr:hypothetical protein [Sulfurospirillum sp.]